MSSKVLESIAVAALSIGVGSVIAAIISSGELMLFQVPEFLVGATVSGVLYWSLSVRFRRGEVWFAAVLGAAASMVAAVLMAVWVVVQSQGDSQVIVLGFILLWVMYGIPLGAAFAAGVVRLVFRPRDMESASVRSS